MARRKGFRDQEEVRSVVLRMGADYVAKLDRVCAVNERSRRVLVEILVDEAHAELEENPDARIHPLTPVQGQG
jgi:hypothetical protein